MFFFFLVNTPFSSAQIPQNGLKAHFPFNSTTSDTTGNNPNATLAASNVGYYNLGISGQALELSPDTIFNSTNPAVEFVQGGLNNINSIIEANNNFTISFWFKSRNSNQFSLISKREICSTSPPYLDIRSESNSSTTSRVMVEMKNGTAQSSSSGPNSNEYNSDCWVHLVSSREVLASGGCIVKTYINGILTKLDTFSQVIQISPTTSNNRLTLAGSPCIGVDGTIPLDGFFDEFMVYDRAISDSEVSAIYNHFFNQPHISLTAQGCILVPIKTIDNAKNTNLNVYPNPSSLGITIELDSKTTNEEAFIALYNLQGQLILNSTFPAGEDKRSIFLDQLPKGMYQVVLSDKRGIVATQKVIIQ
jgi:hypothetical protein